MRATTVVALVLVAGCRSGSDLSSDVIVSAFAADRPAPGITVVSHTPDGDVLDITTTDPTGLADVGVDGDSLVSVVFPADMSITPSVIPVITTVPPADGSKLAVHGPADHSTPPLVVGVLNLTGPTLDMAAYFNVTLGCTTVKVDKLPATINVAACNMGTDQNLDVLVRGYYDSGTPPVPQLVGYAAGRVAMTSDVASFEVSSWQTTGPAVSVTGVQSSLVWRMHVDGMDFLQEPVGTYAYDGLVVDSTSVDAFVPPPQAKESVMTTREIAGVPTSISFTTDDFLPGVALPPSLVAPASVRWEPVGVSCDALWVTGRWGSVAWSAVLPPSSTSVTFPALDGADVMPRNVDPGAITLTAIDESGLDTFASIVGGALHFEKPLAPRVFATPAPGEQVRFSSAAGGP